MRTLVQSVSQYAQKPLFSKSRNKTHLKIQVPRHLANFNHHLSKKRKTQSILKSHYWNTLNLWNSHYDCRQKMRGNYWKRVKNLVRVGAAHKSRCRFGSIWVSKQKKFHQNFCSGPCQLALLISRSPSATKFEINWPKSKKISIKSASPLSRADKTLKN